MTPSRFHVQRVGGGSVLRLSGIAFVGAMLLSAGSAAAFDGSTRASLDSLIARYAAEYELPPELVHRVVTRESGYNPEARNGPNLGLMQIQHPTARTMGYSGPPEGLLDAETNLRFAVRYLAGAYLVAGGNADRAVQLYARGYYYEARRMGLLEETGLRPARSEAAAPLPRGRGPYEIAGGLF
jgi:soluble lytic murein transglycosylase-like protein